MKRFLVVLGCVAAVAIGTPIVAQGAKWTDAQKIEGLNQDIDLLRDRVTYLEKDLAESDRYALQLNDSISDLYRELRNVYIQLAEVDRKLDRKAEK